MWAEGAIVQAQDIEFFAQGCEKMRRGKATEAILAPMEPYLDVELEATNAVGHILMRVRITPDNLTQSHSFN